MADPLYLIIGRVLKPWSYRGELKVEILTEFPERFASLRQVYLGDDANPFSVERARLHSGAVLLKLQGIDSNQAAEKLRGQLVQVSRDDAFPLPQGKVYLYQVLGLKVKTTAGQYLGEITDVIETGANDVYVVRDGERETLIPAIPSVIKETDLAAREMLVELLKGL